MIYPLHNKIYEYNGEEVTLNCQSLFNKVYLRTIPKNGGSTYFSENWWKFAFKAKYVRELPHLSSAY